MTLPSCRVSGRDRAPLTPDGAENELISCALFFRARNNPLHDLFFSLFILYHLRFTGEETETQHYPLGWV